MADLSRDNGRGGGIKDLVSSVAGDVGELLSAHGDQIRREGKEAIADLGASLRAAALAAAAGVVVLIAVSHALAISLIALDVTPWAAYWLVALLAAAGAGIMLWRARSKMKHGHGHPGDALRRAKEDASWAVHRTQDAVHP